MAGAAEARRGRLGLAGDSVAGLWKKNRIDAIGGEGKPVDLTAASHVPLSLSTATIRLKLPLGRPDSCYIAVTAYYADDEQAGEITARILGHGKLDQY